MLMSLLDLLQLDQILTDEFAKLGLTKNAGQK